MTSTIYYLEQTAPAQLIPKSHPGDACQLVECQVKSYPINRFFYHYVGQPWQWLDKAQWRDDQWQAYAERDALRLFMLQWQGSPAGYVELEKHPNGSVEIAYLGVAQPFLPHRLGGFLLTEALREAWLWGASRVWVHTCSEDHPHALANYQARGMQLYKVEEVSS